jgi:RNA polymerase-binding transcription factor DksA
VNRALDRLEHGGYGTCEACGNEIAEGRLGALPFATRCIRCAA